MVESVILILYATIGTICYMNAHAYLESQNNVCDPLVRHHIQTENFVATMLLAGVVWPIGYLSLIIAFFDEKPWRYGVKFKPY